MKIIAKDTFGWNGKAWRATFENSELIKEALKRKKLKILEIGAGRYSQVAFEFDVTCSEITIGYYLPSDKSCLENRLDYMSRKYDLQSCYTVCPTDLFNITGKYDVIIMKSVLGGVFRDNFNIANSFCKRIANENLHNGGIVVSIDNARSIFEPILKNFGARRNKWYYINRQDLKSADEQISFGFLSSFALSTRLGSVGTWIEDILYLIDKRISRFQSSNYTVICSIFKKNI